MDKTTEQATEIVAEKNRAITLDELEGLDMDAFASQEQPEGYGWRITDDACADWAVQKIAEERAEFERIKALADKEIDRIMEKVQAAERRHENGTAYLTAKLAEYFATVPHKTTKTTRSYRLLSGVLKMKLGGVSMKQDDAKLLEYLKTSGHSDMIKTSESVKWGDYKKRLEIVGGVVVDKATGEIVEGVDVIEKPDVFTIDL